MYRTLTLFLLLFCQTSFGQLSWHKAIPVKSDEAPRVQIDEQGSQYVVSKYGSNYNEWLLLKINPTDQILWSRIIKGSNYITDKYTFKLHKNRLYIYSSLYGTPSEQRHLIYCFDTSGVYINGKGFTINSQEPFDGGSMCFDTDDNLYIQTSDWGGMWTPRNSYLSKFTPDLQPFFSKKIINQSFDHDFMSLRFLGGNLLVAGYQLSMAFDLNGNLKTSTKYTGLNAFHQIVLWSHHDPGTENTGFFLAYRDEYFWVLELDKNGRLIKSSESRVGSANSISIDKNNHVFIEHSDNIDAIHDSQRHLLQFDPELRLLKRLSYQNDSIYRVSRIIPQCNGGLKFFSTSARGNFMSEYKLNFDAIGAIVKMKYSSDPLRSIKFVSADTLMFVTSGNMNIKEAPPLHVRDTAVNPYFINVFPICRDSSLLANDTTICPGDSIVQSIKVPFPKSECDKNIFSINWENSSSDSIRIITEPGLYRVQYQFAQCSYTDEILIRDDTNVWPYESNLEFCRDGQSLTLDAGPNYLGLWSPNNSRSITISKSGSYVFKGTNSIGCVFEKSVTVNEYCDFMAYLPSAFTPDGDGNNDVFCPVGAAIITWKLSVYDRFGNPVYEGDQNAGGWNGNDRNHEPVNGLFVVRLEYTDLKGEEKTVFGKLLIQR